MPAGRHAARWARNQSKLAATTNRKTGIVWGDKVSMKIRTLLLSCAIAALVSGCVWAADNALTDAEKANGWKLLFDGRSLAGWHAATDIKDWAVEDGTIAAVPKDGDYLITDESFGNFVVSLDFKEDTNTNSGVFLRRPAKAVKGCRGIECQIYYKKNGAETGKHACGSVYDAVAPSKNACKGPGVWQSMTIDCRDNMIKVTLNGALVTTMNLDEWTVAGKAPDGSPNKFTVAYKDMPRTGGLALQNHGTKVWFKNIKIKPLDKSGK